MQVFKPRMFFSAYYIGCMDGSINNLTGQKDTDNFSKPIKGFVYSVMDMDLYFKTSFADTGC